MLKKILRSVRHRLIESPRGFGHPVSAEAFDNEYRSGHWRLLAADEELVRYNALVDLIRKHTSRPRLLDAGCGNGRLGHFFKPGELAFYHGVDLSHEAIRQGEAHPPAHALFSQANIETWHPTHNYDAIVANEVIGYFHDPAATLTHLAKSLPSDSPLIVSLYRWGNAKAIWRRIHTRFTPIETVSVVSLHSDKMWDIEVMNIRSPTEGNRPPPR